jgi:DNA polymerase
MSTQQPTLDGCIESLRLHIRSRQRTGLRFDVGSRRADPSEQMSRAQLLETLRNESSDCRRCPLCIGRTHVVFGEGNGEARLMFVGGAPDSVSDTQGRTFAGESGQLLTKIIEAIKLQRSQVYLTTAVKCISPGDPGDDALEACLPFLQRQIEIIQPDIICALGPIAARILQEPAAGSVPPRGTLHRMGTILVMPTHHPELLLSRPELKNETWRDVQIIQRELDTGTTRKQ